MLLCSLCCLAELLCKPAASFLLGQRSAIFLGKGAGRLAMTSSRHHPRTSGLLSSWKWNLQPVESLCHKALLFPAWHMAKWAEGFASQAKLGVGQM